MHSVFLYHALPPARHGDRQRRPITIYDDIEPELRDLAEDVILNRRPTRRPAAEMAGKFKGDTAKAKEKDLAWRDAPVQER